VTLRSYKDPPSGETVLAGRTPVIVLIDTKTHGTDWLERAVSLVQHLSRIPTVILLEANSTIETRFAFGDRCYLVQHPLRISRLLDLISSLVPNPLRFQPWRDAHLVPLIDLAATDGAKLSLRPLAALVRLSPWHLSRRFRQAAGFSLRAYLTMVRVHEASELIEHTDAKLDDIASRLGFHDASHLSRVFVRLTGRRPGKHRKAAMVPPVTHVGQRGGTASS
jgi:AraC-like DNA-binding protein